MALFAREEFQIDLRVATIPVGAIRAAGRDVRVARYGASPHCAYAMFAGGGLAWFEASAKRGEYALAPAAPGARPDLSNLSCRWSVAPAKHGLILSVVVAPRGEDPRFAALVEDVVRLALGAADGGRPITVSGLGMGRPGEAIALETAATAAPGVSRGKARLAAARRYLLAHVFHKFKLRAGGFDAASSTPATSPPTPIFANSTTACG